MRKGLYWFILSIFFLPAAAQAQQDNTADFTRWLEQLRTNALLEGIRPETVSKALSDVTLSDKVLALDARQPEFSLGFWDYYRRGLSKGRIATGKKKIQQQKKLLAELERQYDIQSRFIIALWGLESDHGRVTGDHQLVNALVTLAYKSKRPKRRKFFRKELIQLLHIFDKKGLTLEKAYGSWAGAIGQTQFMPSTYLLHGTDGDNDGRIDLIASSADALTSAARYLRALQWDAQKTWGREVVLPENFDYHLARLNLKKNLSEWHRLGVRKVDNSSLPTVALEASLIVPAGADGPAFLVYENFRRLMRWNNSIFYALNVGLLADAIAERNTLLAKPDTDYKPLKSSEILKIQEALAQRSFDPGTPDGIIGRKTRQALRDFQLQNGLIPDGYPNMATRKLLR